MHARNLPKNQSIQRVAREFHIVLTDSGPRVLGYSETVLHAPSGTFVHNDLAGHLSITLRTIRAVSVANLADVADYRITRDEEGVTHWVRFHGGGGFHVQFDSDGELIFFEGDRVTVAADDSVLVASRYQPPPDDLPGL